MIYIIGIDHLVQYNGPVPGDILDEFKIFLHEKIDELKISVIAEEFNEEFLCNVLNATEGTAKLISERCGIIHIYCDPDESEREMLRIPYFADIKESVKKRLNINQKFITDYRLRKLVDAETSAEVKKYWDVREKFWFERIKGSLSENILFLCGHEHVVRFLNLLHENSVDALIIDQFWRRDLFSDYSRIGLM